MKKTLLICLLLSSKFIFSQVKNDKLLFSKISVDSIVLTIPQKTILKAEIIRGKPRGNQICNDCGNSDTSLIIKDAKNKVLLYKHDAFDPETRINYSVFSLKLAGIGQVLAIQEIEYPTVASDQGNLTLYVLNSLGNLVQICPTVPLSGNFANGDLVKMHQFSKGRKFIQQQENCKDCTWIIETKNFTGQCGFEIGQFFHLSLDGKFKNSPVLTDSVPVYAGKNNLIQLRQFKNPIRITLFDKPFDKEPNKKMLLTSNATIRFYSAKSKKNQVSIWVSVNGTKGYLQDLQELAKLGYPSCD